MTPHALDAMGDEAADEVAPDSTWSGWYALGVLVAATLFSISDRYIFSLLAEPIRHALGLSDTQIGLLQGFGLSLFAAIVSFPIGWLADRFDRRWILCGCVAVWSLGVAGCGLAQSFPTLFLASAIVGAGEAGLIPIVYGLIPELFRGRRRAAANATYAFTVKLGVSLGVAACGWLVYAVEHYRDTLPDVLASIDVWRLAFLGAALPALVIIPLIASIRIGPSKPIAPRVRVNGEPNPVALSAYLRQQWRTLIPFLAGVGFMAFGSSAAISWAPMIAMRTFHDSPQAVGSGLAISNLVGTLVGSAAAFYALRYFSPRVGATFPIRVEFLSAAAGVVTMLAPLAAHDATTFYVLQGVQIVFSMAGQLVFPTIVQDLAPAQLRSRIASLSYMVAIGFVAASPVVVGIVSDQLHDLSNGLLLASVVTAATGLAIASVLIYACQRNYLSTVEAAKRLTASAVEANPRSGP